MAGSLGRKLGKLIQFRALPSQRKLIYSDSRFKGFSGPVGSGKSTALAFSAIRLAYKNPGRVGLIGAPTYTMLRDVTMRSFTELCGELGIDYELNKSSFTVTLPWANGALVLFRSLDEPERLRGANLAWFGVDELTYCREDAWHRLEARLRDPKAGLLCGFAVWTPKGFDWVNRKFRTEKVEGYELIEARPFENKHLLASTPDYYDRLKASYGEGFYKQEALGEYLNLTAGQVYTTFRREEHVGRFEVAAMDQMLWSWDFNVNPMASLIAQRDREEIHVIDEIFLRTSSTTEVCEEFDNRYGGHRGGILVTGDASGEQRHSSSRYSDYDLIRRYFARRPELKGTVQVGKSNPPVRERLNLVNGSLKCADGGVRLRVDERCRELIRDLEQVCYKADSGVVDKNADPDRTHLADALGYLLWAEELGRRRVGERGERLI